MKKYPNFLNDLKNKVKKDRYKNQSSNNRSICLEKKSMRSRDKMSLRFIISRKELQKSMLQISRQLKSDIAAL
jgi:hypothetical protein